MLIVSFICEFLSTHSRQFYRHNDDDDGDEASAAALGFSDVARAQNPAA